MTQQYLVGELSLLLEELRTVATNEAAAWEIACLRQEVETTPPAALAPVVKRAVELTNRVCWETLKWGDVATFVREVAIGAELREFGVCAGLLEEDELGEETGHS